MCRSRVSYVSVGVWEIPSPFSEVDTDGFEEVFKLFRGERCGTYFLCQLYLLSFVFGISKSLGVFLPSLVVGRVLRSFGVAKVICFDSLSIFFSKEKANLFYIFLFYEVVKICVV